mgnify:CR=1 FL=1
MLTRFFLIDWIVTYIEKPQIEQTPADEMLFYTALLIICGTVFGVVFVGIAIKEWLSKRGK